MDWMEVRMPHHGVSWRRERKKRHPRGRPLIYAHSGTHRGTTQLKGKEIDTTEQKRGYYTHVRVCDRRRKNRTVRKSTFEIFFFPRKYSKWREQKSSPLKTCQWTHSFIHALTHWGILVVLIKSSWLAVSEVLRFITLPRLEGKILPLMFIMHGRLRIYMCLT